MIAGASGFGVTLAEGTAGVAVVVLAVVFVVVAARALGFFVAGAMLTVAFVGTVVPSARAAAGLRDLRGGNQKKSGSKEGSDHFHNDTARSEEVLAAGV